MEVIEPLFTIKWPDWYKIVNDHFLHLIYNKDRYVISFGGRGSAKSNTEAKKLIYRCLTEKYFRHILIRNTYATIKDSSYQTIKDIIFELGLDELFEFKLQPLEIHCVNGNCFLARGCDDTQKIKSVKDPTGAWWEEDIPTEEDFITVTTSIRTQKAAYLQETFTINPEVEGNYQDNWFWKRFFLGKNELSFRDVTFIKMQKSNEVTLLFEEIECEMPYTVLHSTYENNKWLPDQFIAFLVDLKRTNPYYWTIYCRGNWGNKQLGGRFYKNFDMGRHTYNFNYNPSLPLHISFDFNVNPYMSLSIWQIEGKGCYLIDEIAMEDPKNKVKDTCREFVRKYNTHPGGLYVYGDPSGKQEDVGRDKGYNHYSTIEVELAKFHPTFRIAASHPPVKTRGDFINTVFEVGFDGWSIMIFEKSVYMKNDFLFGKEDSDGTKHKEKVKGANGVTYEKHHHFSDGFDYLFCEVAKESFQKYQRGDVSDHRRPMGRNVISERNRL